MKRFSVKSNVVISILAILSIVALFTVEKSKTDVKQKWFDEKLESAVLSQKAMEFLKKTQMEKGIFVDNINDPNETCLIGEEFTQLTTGRGSLPIKLSTTNPNFAALVVQEIKDAGIKKNDKIAVCMTGSFPALNIATYAAIQSLSLKPIIILSVTSSSWGANNPDFTWLDMQTLLYQNGFFNFKAKYASIGGNEDIGQALSIEGRELAIKAIDRNGMILINKGNLGGNITERLKIIKDFGNDKPIKLFINVGGGIASLGSKNNGQKISSGLNERIKLSRIPDKKGVIFEMAKDNIPIIHLLNLSTLMKKYDLPENPIPIPKPGEGKLFFAERYNMLIVSIVTLFLLVCISFAIFIDKKNNKPDSDIISNEIQI